MGKKLVRDEQTSRACPARLLCLLASLVLTHGLHYANILEVYLALLAFPMSTVHAILDSSVNSAVAAAAGGFNMLINYKVGLAKHFYSIVKAMAIKIHEIFLI